MKKFELHLDALITIAVLFVAAVGFIVFQWQQNSMLAQRHIDLQLKVVMLELQQARLEAIEKKCAAAKP
jgi:hypothetical protein